MNIEDTEAKRRFIVAFFDSLDDKIRFLERLVGQDRSEEARLLCICYLDGLCNWLQQEPKSFSWNWTYGLTRFSDDVIFKLIVPISLRRSLPWKSVPPSAKSPIARALNSLKPKEALLPEDFIRRIESLLSCDDLEWLQKELWRGSIAAMVYTNVRGPNVHWLGSAHALIFPDIKFNSEPLPPIDLFTLCRCLANVATHARSVSLRTNKWFGLTEL